MKWLQDANCLFYCTSLFFAANIHTAGLVGGQERLWPHRFGCKHKHTLRYVGKQHICDAMPLSLHCLWMKRFASLRQSRHAQNRASAWQNLFYSVCLKDYNNGLTLTLPWEQQLLICALQFTSFFWNSQPHFMVFILIVNFIVHSFSFSNDLDMEYHSRDNIQLHT